MDITIGRNDLTYRPGPLPFSSLSLDRTNPRLPSNNSHRCTTLPNSSKSSLNHTLPSSTFSQCTTHHHSPAIHHDFRLRRTPRERERAARFNYSTIHTLRLILDDFTTPPAREARESCEFSPVLILFHHRPNDSP